MTIEEIQTKLKTEKRPNIRKALETKLDALLLEQTQETNDDGSELIKPGENKYTGFSSYKAYKAALEQLKSQGFTRMTVGWPYGEGQFTGTVTANENGELFGIVVIASKDRKNFIETVQLSDIYNEVGESLPGTTSAQFQNLELQDGDPVGIKAKAGKDGTVYARISEVITV